MADFDFREYLTAYVFCTVFPIEKTKNGFYKCRLNYKRYNKIEKSIEWVIPAQYLEENGHVTANHDIYFARWLVRQDPDVYRDENGEPKKDVYGQVRVGMFLHFGRLIEFWNTRIFGKPTKLL